MSVMFICMLNSSANRNPSFPGWVQLRRLVWRVFAYGLCAPQEEVLSWARESLILLSRNAIVASRIGNAVTSRRDAHHCGS